MIALTKTAEPNSLIVNAETWTQVLIDHRENGTKPTDTELGRYNNDEIKTALKKETHKKCAYCESKFSHVAYGDIEHIVPKKLDPKLRFQWSNLTIACDICNTGKGQKEQPLDPYGCDPEKLFMATGPMLLPRPESAVAVRTEIALKLNRGDLLEKRAERIKSLHTVYSLGINHADPATSKIIIDDLIDTESKKSQEFAAISRAFLALIAA